MSSGTSLFEKSGAMQLPLANTAESTLASLDPARDILLGLFKAAINAELAPRWGNATGNTVLSGVDPVADTLPMMPTQEVLQVRDTRFPLLCVYRTDDEQTISEFTLSQRQVVSKWGVDYVLGPLTPAEIRKLYDVLPAVARILYLTVENSGHRAYSEGTHTSGVKYAKNVLGRGDGTAGFSNLTVDKLQYGTARFADDSPTFHALSMVLESAELDLGGALGDCWGWDGVSYSFDSEHEAGIAQDFVQMDTDATPPNKPPVGT